jgi:uncharacterized protein DUF6882
MFKLTKIVVLVTLLALGLTHLNCKPMPRDEPKFVALVTKAHEYLTAQQDRNEKEFALSTYPRWDWNQDTGELIFSEHGQPKVIAKIQFVGDVSSKSKTWLWAWANPTIEYSLQQAARQAKKYGVQKGIWQLAESTWLADEVDGWEMTSITAMLVNAKGAYKTPDENGSMFMVFTDIRWATAPVSK